MIYTIPKVGAIKPITEVYGGVTPHSGDALAITSDYKWNGLIARVDRSNSINMPADVSNAIKWVYQYNDQNIVVILLELYPIFGRQWFNKYTTSDKKWSGWKSITPQ